MKVLFQIKKSKVLNFQIFQMCFLCCVSSNAVVFNLRGKYLIIIFNICFQYHILFCVLLLIKIYLFLGLGCTTVLSPESAALAAAQILSLTDHVIWSRLKAQQLNRWIDLKKADAKITINWTTDWSLKNNNKAKAKVPV